jgi:hypothetical protein
MNGNFCVTEKIAKKNRALLGMGYSNEWLKKWKEKEKAC